MTSNSYTFIVVPDAKSQCKRVNIPTTAFYILGVGSIILLVVAGIILNSLLSDYNAVSSKAVQVETLKKVSISRQETIDRYEEEVAQLSNALAHIQHLNSRLMVLAGLDPERGEQTLGLGGSDEGSSKTEDEE